jgi:inner membrane protein
VWADVQLGGVRCELCSAKLIESLPKPPPDVLPPLPPAGRDLAEAGSSWARRSVTLKLIAIAALVVLLLIPALLLGGLIREREMLRDQARREVASRWGIEQTVGGPVLSIPYVVSQTTETGAVAEITRYAHFLPDDLQIEGTMQPELRSRGIHEVVLYRSRLRLRGRFPQPDPTDLGVPAASVRPADAFVSIGITDMTGVDRAVRLRWADSTVAAEPGIPTTDVFQSGVHVPVTLAPSGDGYAFEVALDLNGSGLIGFLPFGKETRARLSAPWGSPSFTGAFLPDERTVSDTAFDAQWHVLHLNRNYGQAFLGAFGQPTQLVVLADGTMPYPDRSAVAPAGPGAPSAFGVELKAPVDEYRKTARATKYCMLMVFLTFVTFFFVEVLGGRRIHPVQYLLVGFAITLFYLLLLSFSEYIPFGGAYALAGVAVLALVTLYAKAIFGEWRLAGLVAGLLALFYGYFYVLLQLEAYALLFGSLGLLATLAVVMYLSRGVDWYGMAGANGGRAGPTEVPPVARD